MHPGCQRREVREAGATSPESVFHTAQFRHRVPDHAHHPVSPLRSAPLSFFMPGLLRYRSALTVPSSTGLEVSVLVEHFFIHTVLGQGVLVVHDGGDEL